MIAIHTNWLLIDFMVYNCIWSDYAVVLLGQESDYASTCYAQWLLICVESSVAMLCDLLPQSGSAN